MGLVPVVVAGFGVMGEGIHRTVSFTGLSPDAQDEADEHCAYFAFALFGFPLYGFSEYLEYHTLSFRSSKHTTTWRAGSHLPHDPEGLTPGPERVQYLVEERR